MNWSTDDAERQEYAKTAKTRAPRCTTASGQSFGLKVGKCFIERVVKNHSSPTEQILLVKGINVGYGILFDDPIGDDDGTAFVCNTNAVEGNNLASKR